MAAIETNKDGLKVMQSQKLLLFQLDFHCNISSISSRSHINEVIPKNLIQKYLMSLRRTEYVSVVYTLS